MRELIIISRIISRLKIGLLTQIVKLIYKLIPAKVLDQLKIYLIPLFLIGFKWFKYFNLILGLFFLFTLIDFSNISIREIYNGLVVAKDFIKNEFFKIIDYFFKTKYSDEFCYIDTSSKQTSDELAKKINESFTAFAPLEEKVNIEENQIDYAKYLKIAGGVILLTLTGVLIYRNFDSIRDFFSSNGGNGSPNGGGSSYGESTASNGSGRSSLDNERATTGLGGNRDNQSDDSLGPRVLPRSPNSLDSFNPSADPWNQDSGGTDGFAGGSSASPSNSNTSTPKASTSRLAEAISGIPVSPNPFACLEDIDSNGSPRSQIEDFARKIKARNGF